VTRLERERKRNLLTIRLTDEEKITLDYLSDYMDKSKSDIMLRACQYFINFGGSDHGNDRGRNLGDGRDGDRDGNRGGNRGGKGTEERAKLEQRVHVRMSDSDMERVQIYSNKTGITISQLIREGIKALAKGINIPY
jgi:predicted DNA-binding protein